MEKSLSQQLNYYVSSVSLFYLIEAQKNIEYNQKWKVSGC